MLYAVIDINLAHVNFVAKLRSKYVSKNDIIIS